jgi:hypothetical protein
MVAPLTPKPTRKAEALARVPPTIVSRREEDAALKEEILWRAVKRTKKSSSHLIVLSFIMNRESES